MSHSADALRKVGLAVSPSLLADLDFLAQFSNSSRSKVLNALLAPAARAAVEDVKRIQAESCKAPGVVLTYGGALGEILAALTAEGYKVPTTALRIVSFPVGGSTESQGGE